jgi:hypothetical protein
LELREIGSSFGKGAARPADPRRNGREAAAWVRDWSERSARLLKRIAGIDCDALESAAELLREVRECRRRPEPADPVLRSLWHRALDDSWEAACSALYGDLGPARQHADNAFHRVQEMRRLLAARSC